MVHAIKYNKLFHKLCSTCAAKVGCCLIERDSDSSVGIPTSFGGGLESTYSCVAFGNCKYDVHVIGNYRSSKAYTSTVAGDIDVHLTVTGESHRPLILVLTSYRPVKWRLNVTNGVIIDRVILVSKNITGRKHFGYRTVYSHFN